MSDNPKLVIRIDPDLERELSATVEREERTKTTIVERALRDYIARSKAEAKATKKTATQPEQA